MTELEMLNEIAAAAADLDKILTALILTGQAQIVTTDLGGAAIQDRMNRLNEAGKALRSFRSKSPA